MSEQPKPPTGLRAPGRRVWDDAVGSYEFSAGELEILRQAVRAVETADRIERELRKQPLSVQGYNGQPRPNPLIRMLQDQQLLIRRLVDSLNIPLPDQEAGFTANQRHAQHAANVRWGRTRGAS